MELLSFAGIAAFIAVVAQTGMMFYWGGQLQAMVKRHDRDIDIIEERVRELEFR